MMRWIRLIVFMLCFSAFNLLGNSANETELTDHIIYIKYADYSMLRSLSSIPENLPVITKFDSSYQLYADLHGSGRLYCHGEDRERILLYGLHQLESDKTLFWEPTRLSDIDDLSDINDFYNSFCYDDAYISLYVYKGTELRDTITLTISDGRHLGFSLFTVSDIKCEKNNVSISVEKFGK